MQLPEKSCNYAQIYNVYINSLHECNVHVILHVIACNIACNYTGITCVYYLCKCVCNIYVILYVIACNITCNYTVM